LPVREGRGAHETAVREGRAPRAVGYEHVGLGVLATGHEATVGEGRERVDLAVVRTKTRAHLEAPPRSREGEETHRTVGEGGRDRDP
jgi:hypothetical protein